MVAEIKNFYDNGSPKDSKLASIRTEQQMNEHLASVSNRFLEMMSKTVHKYGGDVIQFLGNSLVAVWLPHSQLQ